MKMQCPKCHGNIPDNSKFCTLCGAKIEAVITPVQPASITQPEQPETHPVSPDLIPPAAAGANANPVSFSSLKKMDFKNLSVKNLITLQALAWIIPVLGLVTPTYYMSSYGYTVSGSLFDQASQGNAGEAGFMAALVWILILATVAVFGLGLWLAFKPGKQILAANFAAAGIVVSTYFILWLSMTGMVVGLGSLLGGSAGLNFWGQIVRVFCFAELLASIYLVWLMAVQNKRIS